MHSGAKLLRKTLTGTERVTEHKARKSKSLIRPDKKVKKKYICIYSYIFLNLFIYSITNFLDIGWYTTCRDNETLCANCSSRFI